MKLLLISPTNKLFTPYLYNYINILIEKNIEYEVAIWDRLHYSDSADYVYMDNKVSGRRNFYDYMKYGKYINEILERNEYDKVIVFGVQILFFIQQKLYKNYKNKFIVDIRDYNKILKLINIRRLNDHLEFFVLSSPGYKQFLPRADKILINHNSEIKSIKQLENNTGLSNKKPLIKIGNIGGLRDLDANFNLIRSLKNDGNFQLNFNGYSSANEKLTTFLKNENIKNVNVTGRYERFEEKVLYKENDMINVIRYPDSLNNKVALPNRLYNATTLGIPLLSYEGTHLSEIIQEYNLGLVLNTFNNVDKQIIDFFENFETQRYDLGRKEFMKTVIKDNEQFVSNIIK